MSKTDALVAEVTAERDRLREALERVRENATSWHGPLVGTGHERALAVIATWCDTALREPGTPT